MIRPGGKMSRGAVPFQSIQDASSRNAVIALNENIRALAEQVKTLQKAVAELQKKMEV